MDFAFGMQERLRSGLSVGNIHHAERAACLRPAVQDAGGASKIEFKSNNHGLAGQRGRRRSRVSARSLARRSTMARQSRTSGPT